MTLARRGLRTVGLDAHTPPHRFGSSHGETRMIREAYFQGAAYVPLVQAAYDRWASLEREAGRPLLRITGGLMVGAPGSAVYEGCLASARAHGLAHEILDRETAGARYPVFRLEPGTGAILEPRAGFLATEACIECQLSAARASGATLRYGVRVDAIDREPDGLVVRTADGPVRADRLVVAAGAWTSGLVPELALPLVIDRTVQFWFDPVDADTAGDYAPDRCPVWVWEYDGGTTWYGFPATERGVKAGMHVAEGRRTSPESLDREVHDHEVAEMRAVLERFLPGAAGPLRDASVCMYTNTPDEGFILDLHPEDGRLAIFTGGSGHAFKFAPVLGEALADLVTGSASPFDLSPFRIDRF